MRIFSILLSICVVKGNALCNNINNENKVVKNRLYNKMFVFKNKPFAYMKSKTRKKN